MQCLVAKRKQRWEGTVESIDFTHSSRVVWKTFNRFTERSSQPDNIQPEFLKHCSPKSIDWLKKILLSRSETPVYIKDLAEGYCGCCTETT